MRDVVEKNLARAIDCWWQTETGAVMMSPTPCPTDESSVPSTCTRGFYGIDPVLLDDSVWFSSTFRFDDNINFGFDQSADCVPEKFENL